MVITWVVAGPDTRSRGSFTGSIFEVLSWDDSTGLLSVAKYVSQPCRQAVEQ